MEYIFISVTIFFKLESSRPNRFIIFNLVDLIGLLYLQQIIEVSEILK